MRSRAAFVLTTATLLFVSTESIRAQGTLTPPGAPAPTMKSLDQIAATQEARIAIETLPGDATAKHIISQPGSYYLRGNLTIASAAQGAIRVTAPAVTIDLNGFAVIGPGSSTSSATAITSTASRVILRNGTILSFASGASLSSNSTVEDLSVAEVGNIAVLAFGANTLARNIVVNNAGAVGVSAGIVEHCTVSNVSSSTLSVIRYGIDGVVVRGCHVSGVTTTGATDAYGIRARVIDSCRANNITSGNNAFGLTTTNSEAGAVQNSFVEDVNGSGASYGIQAGTVQTCTVTEVSSVLGTAFGIAGREISTSNVLTVDVTGSSATANGISAAIVRDCRVSDVDSLNGPSFGIQSTAVAGCIVTGIGMGETTGEGMGLGLTNNATASLNSVASCRTVGIRVYSNSVIRDNTVSSVGTAAGITDGTHLLVVGSDNILDGNQLAGGTGSDYGVRAITVRNLIVRNRASGTFTGAATGATGLDTPEYNLPGGNRFGPMAVVLASGEVSTTNPHANHAD